MKLFYLFFITVFMCFYTYGQSTYSGKIIHLPNPCKEEPCLPGLVFGLEINSNNYILTIDSNWIWSNKQLIIQGVDYLIGNEVEIIGTTTIKQDVYSSEYTELEITSIQKRSLSNNEAFYSYNRLVFYDMKTQIITIDKPSQSPSLVLELMDMQGKVVLRQTGLSHNSSVSMGNLLNGMYIYRLTGDGGIISKGKLVKSH